MANKAAWLVGKQARPLKVDDAPMPEPGPDDIIVRNHTVAINPVDAIIQISGGMVTEFPAILGLDAAGEVYAVGSNVKNFRKGDRVLYSADYTKFENGVLASNFSTAAFQLFVPAREPLIAKTPTNVSFAEAAVLPEGLCVAAVGCFQKNTLNLPLPKIDPKETEKVVLVWGGASSMGSCAVQLIRAAGYEVAATASEKNAEYLKSLGAKYVFDYKSPTVGDEIADALKGTGFAGAFDTVSTFAKDAVVKCADVASRLGGNKFVATVLPPGNVNNLSLPDGLPEDVKFGFNWGTALKHNEIGPAIWGEWLTAALENGSMKCKPDPLIVGQGLEKIQDALDRWTAGVSAQKIVGSQETELSLRRV